MPHFFGHAMLAWTFVFFNIIITGVDARNLGPLIPQRERQVVMLTSSPTTGRFTAAVWSTQSCRLFYMVNDTTTATSAGAAIKALQLVSANDDLQSKGANLTTVLGPASGGIAYGIAYTLNSYINTASYLLRSFALVESSSQDDLYFPDYALLRKYTFAAVKGCSGSCGTCIGGSYTDAATASTISNGTTRYGLLPDSYALAVRASTGDVFGPAYNYVYQVTSSLVFYYASSARAGAPTATGMYTATTRWAAKLMQPYTIVIYDDVTMFISDPPFGTVWSVDLGSGAFVAVVGNGTSTNSTCNTTCATQSSGFSLWAPTAMAVYSGGDFSGPTLYIFESKNYVIWAYSITQALITPVVGTTARTGSTNGAALGGATLGAVSCLTMTSIALVIVEPHTIRYVNIRRPTTLTHSLSSSIRATVSRSTTSASHQALMNTTRSSTPLKIVHRSKHKSMTPSLPKKAPPVVRGVPRNKTSTVVVKHRRPTITVQLVRRQRDHTKTFARAIIPPPAVATTNPSSTVLTATLGIDARSAQAVIATAYGGSAISGVLSPTAANKQPAAARVLQASQCDVLNGQAGTFPVPDDWSLMPPLSIHLGDDGSTGAATALGMCLSTTVVTLSIFVINIAWGAIDKDPPASNVVTQSLSALHVIAVTFFGPTLMGTGVTLMRFPDLPVMYSVLGAGTVFSVITVVVLTLFAVLPDQPPHPNAMHLRWALSKHWSSFREGNRDDGKWYVRCYVAEDLGVSLVVSAIGGVYPQSRIGCMESCLAMCVITGLHLGYLLVIRPHLERVDSVLSVMNAMLLLGIALCATVALATSMASAVVTAFGVAMLLANAFFILQALVLCFVGIYFYFTRQTTAERVHQTADAQRLLLQVPTMVAAGGKAKEEEVRLNPLINPSG